MMDFARVVGVALLGLASLALGQGPEQCEVMGLHPHDRPSGPQETTASLGKSRKASVYQWGIVHLPPAPEAAEVASSSRYLSAPDFVHKTPGSSPVAGATLDYSALYVHPPMMLAEPLKFDVQMKLAGGQVRGWYPFAKASGDAVTWQGVLAGVQADGLETTHSQWMTARAVTAPATLKVYKPGPAGSKPDDAGTTEGEVFLFARGVVDESAVPVSMVFDADGKTVRLQVDGDTSGPLHGWVVQPEIGTDHQCEGDAFRVDTLYSEGEKTLQVHPSANDLQSIFCAENLRMRWNEAFVGSGLPSDEAEALTQLLAQSVTGRRVVVVLLPQHWVDEMMPLEISGAEVEPPVRVFVVVGVF